MQISKSQHKQYWDLGWVAVENVFTPAQVDAAVAAMMEMAERNIRADDGVMKVDRSPDGRGWSPRKLENVFGSNEFFRKMLFPSFIPGLIEQFIGVRPLLMDDEIFFKPPHHGSAKAYHQDNSYFCGEPADHIVNAWIALDDADEANGCLRYINGSHRGPVLPTAPIPGREHDLTPDPALVDLSKEALAPVKKGGIVFHHGNALHASGPNHSDRWRRAYATFWVGADVVLSEGFRKKAYFSKPELWAGLPAGSRGVGE